MITNPCHKEILEIAIKANEKITEELKALKSGKSDNINSSLKLIKGKTSLIRKASLALREKD